MSTNVEPKPSQAPWRSFVILGPCLLVAALVAVALLAATVNQ